MMRRTLTTALVALAAISSAMPTSAGDRLKSFVSNVRRDFRRNNCWPDPFVVPDRAHVYAPFGVMVSNGWRVNNTLGDHHFNPDSNQLTESGVLKIRSILLEAPQQYRSLFVLNTGDATTTAERVQAVQEAAERYSLEGDVPQVLTTNIPVRGWPGDYADGNLRRFNASAPSPRLPASAASSSGGSGGGSGGGAGGSGS